MDTVENRLRPIRGSGRHIRIGTPARGERPLERGHLDTFSHVSAMLGRDDIARRMNATGSPAPHELRRTDDS